MTTAVLDDSSSPEKPSVNRSASGLLDSAAQGLLNTIRSLPCVATTAQTLTTLNIGAVTDQLEKAAYFPLWMSSGRSGRASASLGVSAAASASHRFQISTELTDQRLAAHNRVGAPAAEATLGWRIIPDAHEGHPEERPEQHIALRPQVAQRFEIHDFLLRFAGGSESGCSAYGTGQTLPGAGRRPGSVGVAFVLDILEGFGQLRGLVGTITASGDLVAPDSLELMLMIRIADPAGNLLAEGPLTALRPARSGGTDATYLAFLGEIDPGHPVTLRFSVTEGLLGSNVFENLRAADLDFAIEESRLQSRATTGAIAGSVAAQLNFDPLSLAPITPITTQKGVFDFHDRRGQSLGKIFADMTEGRSFRTSLEGVLLPVFRFGGFGAIRGGTGAFAEARGIMLLNAIISVQPRTLSNLYVFRFAHPQAPFAAPNERTH